MMVKAQADRFNIMHVVLLTLLLTQLNSFLSKDDGKGGRLSRASFANRLENTDSAVDAAQEGQNGFFGDGSGVPFWCTIGQFF